MAGLGLIESPRDHRHFSLYRDLYGAPVRATTDEISARGKLEIQEQQEMPWCGGFSGAYYVQLQEEQGRMSGRFIYGQAKKIDGHPGVPGTTLLAVCQVRQKVGVCRELMYRFADRGDSQEPSAEAFAEALNFRIKTYAQVHTIDEIELGIEQHKGVLAGIWWFSSFRKAPKGILPTPGAGGIRDWMEGGHAICLSGYSRSRGLFEFPNSHGTTWGDEGWGSLPYELINWRSIDGPGVFMEAWAQTDMESKRLLPKAIIIKEGARHIQVDTGQVKLDVPAQIIDGRFVAEVRAIAEALGATAKWDQNTRTATFTL